MRKLSPGRCKPWIVAALAFLALTAPAQAQTKDALRKEIAKLSQDTGDSTAKGQLALISKNPEHGKKLVAASLQMLKDKDSALSYNGALVLARFAIDQKDYKAAEPLYRLCMDKAVKLQSAQKILQSYGELIDALYDGKKYEDAVRICRELLEIKTDDTTPRQYVFIVEDRFGDFGYQEDPDFDVGKDLRPAIHQLMIRALAKQGKYDQALKLADNLVRASDGWEERQLRAWVLAESGRSAEAAKVYEDVLDRISNDKDLTQKGKDAYADHYRRVLSNVYVEANKIDKAADLLKGLIERHPDEPDYYNDLGYIWADHDTNLKEAEDMIRKALDLDRDQRKQQPDFNAAEDRDNGAYLDSLGWVLFKQKKYEDAKKYLTEALKDKNSQHIEIFDHLGDTYLALGQRDKAVEAWQQGVKVAGEARLEKERKVLVEKKLEKNK